MSRLSAALASCRFLRTGVVPLDVAKHASAREGHGVNKHLMTTSRPGADRCSSSMQRRTRQHQCRTFFRCGTNLAIKSGWSKSPALAIACNRNGRLRLRRPFWLGYLVIKMPERCRSTVYTSRFSACHPSLYRAPKLLLSQWTEGSASSPPYWPQRGVTAMNNVTARRAEEGCECLF
jgi:hypothetical protein